MWVLGLLCAFNVLSNAGSIAFDPVLSMTSSLSADQQTATFIVTFKAKGWFGFGVSLDGTMGSAGFGSDIVTCASDVATPNTIQVKRYWVDRYGPPPNGTIVEGANCTEYDEGISVMIFTRSTAAQSVVQRGFNLTGNTTLIWAYNTATTLFNSTHTAMGTVGFNIVPPPPTPSGPTNGALQLDGVLSLKTSLAAALDMITISLKSTKGGWMGFGVSPDGTMTNGGNGSDVVACSNGTVLRYWVTQHAPPTGGVPVPGATCEQSAAGSTMQFTRKVAATSATELPINVTGPTTFIWAYSTSSAVMNFHTNQSGLVYDVHNPPSLAPSSAPSVSLAPTSLAPSLAPTSLAPSPAPTASPTSNASSLAPTAALPIQGGMQLDQVYSLRTSLAATLDTITITLKSTKGGWIGFGVSPDGSMTGGNGSDVVACSNGTVMRYWVTQKGIPTGGVPVNGSTCEQSAGGSTMQFTRQVAATSATERPISVTGATTFIWAYHNASAIMNTRHTNRSGLVYDVHNPPLPPAPTLAPTPAGPIEGGQQLDSVLSVRTSLAATLDTITITLNSTNGGWLGFGVSPDGTMTGGNGSDVVACSNGTVMRYWVTKKGIPTGGVPVNGASCMQSAGGSSMQFTRQVAATSATERPISVTGPTTFIWAYHNASAIMNVRHTNRSGLVYDVHNPPVPPTPTLAPTPAAGPIEGGQQLDSVLSLKTSLAATLDTITITLKSTKGGWMGFGVSPDGSMTGGNGSDVVACSNGTVKRYWVTQKSAPNGGVLVPGATCEQSAGGSTMQFTRQVAATSATERPISVTGPTTFIWAYHDVSALMNVRHVNRSGLVYDVHNPPTPTLAPTPASGPTEGGQQLDPVLSLRTSLAATLDTITISVWSTKGGWIGFGVSPDGTMTDGGNGSDVVACSNGTAMRYWVTEHSAPVGGVIVPGAICEQSAGGSSMKFTRLVAATSATERPISVTGNTTFIWAYNDKQPVMDKFHTNQGGFVYDVHNPPRLTMAPTASAPTHPAPTPGGMHFDDVMSATTSLSADKTTVTFVVTAKTLAWVALGVSPAGTMVDGGKGSDVVACSGGTVSRYWITAYAPPTGGTKVPGATCTQQGGLSIMTFTRAVDADGDQQHGIDPNGFTMFIWAYGVAGTLSFTTTQHQSKGQLNYDIASGQGGNSTISPEATLWIHMLAMLLSWGALLPFGVTFARYMRKHHDAKLWFTVHRTCQYIGWFCQIIGFIMILVYVSNAGGSHFGGTYAYHKIIGLIVVIFGTLQPLNAYFRPHPHPDIDASRGCDDARTCWEFLHKSCGLLAIALGAFNVFSGAYVANVLNFTSAFWLIPVVVGSIAVGSMMLFALNKEICGNGKEDPRPVVGRSERNRKNSEMAGDLRAQLIPE